MSLKLNEPPTFPVTLTCSAAHPETALGTGAALHASAVQCKLIGQLRTHGHLFLQRRLRASFSDYRSNGRRD